MLLLGIDLGTSSVKVAVVDAATRTCIARGQYPENEAEIVSLKSGWAEQSPEIWWENVQRAILKVHAQKAYDPADIVAIGLAYQMHGLVMVDKNQHSLRNCIIWCDSRAVETGDRALQGIGPEKCRGHLLNSPGNFTASRLAWVKENEPAVYGQADKVLLPGDYIGMRLTGRIATTVPALSEGMFWDFSNDEISKDVLNYFGFHPSLFPEIKDVFGAHGELDKRVAETLSLRPGIPFSYKAGDQPNNAFSLNVLEPGEVAATAGTSGVIFAVTDLLTGDPASRINSFAHVNHAQGHARLGLLLCINGAGMLNRWARQAFGPGMDYAQMNAAAASVPAGSEGLLVFPFGNGAERMLNNRDLYAQISHIELNKHGAPHIYRACQEGIAFAFRYGMDIMKENGVFPRVIRAGMSNLFLSETFADAFVNALGLPLELYKVDGSIGAALGGGVGAGVFANTQDALRHLHPLKRLEPVASSSYSDLYGEWKRELDRILDKALT